MICEHCDNEGVTFLNKEDWLKECKMRKEDSIFLSFLIPSKKVCLGVTGLIAIVALMYAQHQYNVFGNIFVPAGSSFRENVGGPLWDYLSEAYRANVDGLKRAYNTEY